MQIVPKFRSSNAKSSRAVGLEIELRRLGLVDCLKSPQVYHPLLVWCAVQSMVIL